MHKPTAEESRAHLAFLEGVETFVNPLVQATHLRAALDREAVLRADRDASVKRAEAAEAEVLEQARLNGMGSEREAKLMAERDALIAQRDALLADVDRGAKDYCDLMDHRDAQHVQIEKLKAALRPFVEYVHDDLRRGKATYELVAVDRHGGGLIGAEDLRRARAALTKGDTQ